MAYNSYWNAGLYGNDALYFYFKILLKIKLGSQYNNKSKSRIKHIRYGFLRGMYNNFSILVNNYWFSKV